MKHMLKCTIGGVFVLALPLTAAEDCAKVYRKVRTQVAAEPGKVLDIVSITIAKDKYCACEIVKAAIEASKAKPPMVAAIVEAAITANPEQTPQITQCAVAVAPDALGEIQKVTATLGVNSLVSGGSNGGFLTAFNPLDFPNGKSTGNGIMPAASTTIAPSPEVSPPIINPPLINPPSVTNVNP